MDALTAQIPVDTGVTLLVINSVSEIVIVFVFKHVLDLVLHSWRVKQL